MRTMRQVLLLYTQLNVKTDFHISSFMLETIGKQNVVCGKEINGNDNVR